MTATVVSTQPLTRRKTRVANLVLILFPIVIGAGMLWLRHVEVQRLASRQIQNYGSVPPFRLTNQDGKPFGSSDLAGKIWIADFIYSTCPGPCPMISTRMSEMQKPLEKTDVHFVSFTVDPDEDTPERLREYASQLRAEPGQVPRHLGSPRALAVSSARLSRGRPGISAPGWAGDRGAATALPGALPLEETTHGGGFPGGAGVGVRPKRGCHRLAHGCALDRHLPLADPLVGLGITLAILLVLKDSVVQMWRRLMDAVDPSLVEQAASAATEATGVLRVSNVRARWIAHTIHAEALIVADAGLTLEAAHRVAEAARHNMLHAVPRLSSVTVHVDPSDQEGLDHHAELAHHDQALLETHRSG